MRYYDFTSGAHDGIQLFPGSPVNSKVEGNSLITSGDIDDFGAGKRVRPLVNEILQFSRRTSQRPTYPRASTKWLHVKSRNVSPRTALQHEHKS